MINGKSAIDPSSIVYDANFVKEQKALLSKARSYKTVNGVKYFGASSMVLPPGRSFFVAVNPSPPLLFNRKNGIISITIILITVK